MGINIGVNILHLMFQFYESLDKIYVFPSREKILTESGNKQLHYLIGMVDMLATCAEVGNQ